MEEKNASDLRIWIALALCAVSHFQLNRLFSDLQVFADLAASGAVLADLYPWHYSSIFTWFDAMFTPGPEGREATSGCFICFCLSALPALYLVTGVGGFLSQSKGGCGDIKAVLFLYAIGYIAVRPEVLGLEESITTGDQAWLPEAVLAICAIAMQIVTFLLVCIFALIVLPVYVAGQVAAVLSGLLSFFVSTTLANQIVVYGFLGFCAFTIGLAGDEEEIADI